MEPNRAMLQQRQDCFNLGESRLRLTLSQRDEGQPRNRLGTDQQITQLLIEYTGLCISRYGCPPRLQSSMGMAQQEQPVGL